jgi:hypothetical protein
MIAIIILGPVYATADSADPIFINELVDSSDPMKQVTVSSLGNTILNLN